MISLNSVSKKYTDRYVLKKITYTFEPGNIYVVKGISGSGKTTLLNIIGLVDTAFEGQLVLDDKNVENMSKKEVEELRASIGYVFQTSLLFSHISIIENLLLFDGNSQQIFQLCETFNVAHLLDKYPNQLSNGERQRFSLIRALLGNKKIIIADEPTAALDKENALEGVSEFAKLRELGYVVIISTHDTIFDRIANYILDLDYGVLDETKNQVDVVDINEKKQGALKQHFLQADVNYSKKRFKKIGFLSIVTLVMLFVTILASLSLMLNLESEYIRKIKTEYPTHVFYDIGSKNTLNLPEGEYKEYRNYIIKGDPLIVPYMDKKDSSLNIPNALILGTFPKNQNEIVINDMFWKQKYKRAKDVVGKTIQVESLGKTFTIVGVLTNDEELLNVVREGSTFPDEVQSKSPTIFLDYDIVSKSNDKVLMSDRILISYPDLEQDVATLTSIKSASRELYTGIIQSKTYTIVFIAQFILISIIVLLIVSFLFLLNVIEFEMFNRKRELGFLRLFGMKEKRVFRILLLEYIFKIGISMILALGCYAIVFIAINQIAGLNLFLTVFETLLLLVSMLLYILVLIRIPFVRIRKKSILELIKV